MICHQCERENEIIEMRIEGAKLVCPKCGIMRDIPTRKPTLAEYKKWVEQLKQELEDKDLEIDRLNKELKWQQEWNTIISNNRD